MILYVNGGSHTAAAKAINSFSFANEDYHHQRLERAPHPDNLKVSYGTVLADTLKMMFVTDAESESSNARIIKTTKEWIEEKAGIVPPEDMFMIIQWADWRIDELNTLEVFEGFHLYLKKLGIKHIFFNGKDNFLDIPEDERYDFGENYISPYLPEDSFDGWLQGNGYSPVITSNEYYGQEAHAAWARHLAQHIKDNKMLQEGYRKL